MIAWLVQKIRATLTTDQSNLKIKLIMIWLLAFSRGEFSLANEVDLHSDVVLTLVFSFSKPNWKKLLKVIRFSKMTQRPFPSHNFLR